LTKQRKLVYTYMACRLVLTVVVVVTGGTTSPMNSTRYLRLNPIVPKQAEM